MNTAVKTALNEAGIKLPLNRRVWLWLKDHPNHTAGELAKALSEDQQAVSGALADLKDRSMVSYTKDYERAADGMNRLLTRYSSLGREFELLPKSKKTGDKPHRVVKKFADTPTPELLIQGIALPEKTKPAPATKDWMENYKLGELRGMYEDLKKLFGE